MINEYTCVIAEDNVQANELMVLQAIENGLKVLDTVKSGTGLMESCRKHGPDIVITDIKLERLSGLDACRALLDQGFSLQIIIISGSNDISDAITGYKIGSVDFLRKPFHPSEFVEAIQKAIKRIEETRMMESIKNEAVNLIRIKKKYRDIDVNEHDIIYVEKKDKRQYQMFLVDGTMHETSTPLEKIKEQCSESFFYPHRSFLVNYRQIKSVVPNLAIIGNYDITFKFSSTPVPLTRRNYADYVELKAKLK